MSISTPIPAEDQAPLPRSNDSAALCLGEAVTTCCGAFVTFHDEALCCKACWKEIF